MKKYFSIIILLCVFAFSFAQNDSIYAQIKLENDLRKVTVYQEMVYHNRTKQPQQQITILNWIAAYQKRGTTLYKRQIEDRNSDLHFAKNNELGSLQTLSAKIDETTLSVPKNLNEENLHLDLPKSLNPGDKINLSFSYEIILPVDRFTGYGSGKNKVFLKYFLLVPDSFPNEIPLNKQFNDTQQTANYNTYWRLQLNLPPNYYSNANLQELQPHEFVGVLKNDPEILITEQPLAKIKTSYNGKNTEVVFGFPVSDEERQHLEFYLPLQLDFIAKKTGLHADKIFISEKFKRQRNFFGNDDIKFWKFRFELFSPAENIDLDYFSIISQKIIDDQIISYKENDHWFKNGLKSYLELQYLKTNYKNYLLLGKLPEISIFKIKPLKILYASKLKLTERYGLAYQYIMTQNLDQKIGEKFSALSNFNDMAISSFETGSLLNFIAEKKGVQSFDLFLKNYLNTHQNVQINTKDFFVALHSETKGDSEFLEELMNKKHRTNFSLKKIKKDGDSLQILVKKNTALNVPFKIDQITEDERTFTDWLETNNKENKDWYHLKNKDPKKLEINSGHDFPESTYRDNYKYTKGFFANTKKIKLKLIQDIPNPEFNEIYVNPRLNFNAYDKLLLGINFKNKSLFDQKFSYSVTPYYSTGTGEITGSGSAVYSFMPPESFYRSLSFGISGSYFHYDYQLSYKKLSGFAGINFNKEPRSAINNSVGLSYTHFQKDLTPEMILKNEYDQYNLWSVNYSFSDNRLIHEKFFGISLQGMEDYKKLTAEAFYRYEYAQNKKIAFRLFGGYFLSNTTRNNIFDYGISRVSNYSFSYGLIGQSASSGILSQQFILADGGFKSYVGSTVNQWITALNVDSHVWKMFNIYADAGVYKNKNKSAEFIWDSGVKVRVIPDFFEVFFPVYSSLGFEPSFKDYGSRIRFTLILNLNSVINTARRGWY